MASCKNKWKWPASPDKVWNKIENVLEVINQPKLVENRNMYDVPEIKKYNQVNVNTFIYLQYIYLLNYLIRTSQVPVILSVSKYFIKYFITYIF